MEPQTGQPGSTFKTELSVVEAKVDFFRLPSWDGTGEINHDAANICEELPAGPFADRALQLEAGVHLHWALPDALTKDVSIAYHTLIQPFDPYF
jgi:hypothetical protein